MTAVVGILNKQAVALAADSAVTISGSNGRKIFNGANKVFTLSKYHPVGIMIYNSASFMSTPWETIIKIYRKQLGKKSFPTIVAYQEDFIKFLHDRKFFTDGSTAKLYIKDYFIKIIDVVINISIKGNKNLLLAPTDENRGEILKLIDSTLEKLIEDSKNAEFCPEMESLTFDDFDGYVIDILKDAIDQLFTKNGFTIEQGLLDKIKKVLYEYLRSQHMAAYTGLIFTGFGEDEIYPSLRPVNISFAFGNRLKYFVDESMAADISNESAGAICPFAQTDVIDTILSGIDPTLDKTYLQNFESFFNKYNQEILATLGDANAELTAKIESLDVGKIVEEYTRKNAETKALNYINPLMNAVSTLSKPDLAEMAESLIYLTYLKRRITFAEESVGGPVDVAIISKGDGFIWVKRKHYFKPELNQHFFGNYFNEL